MLFKLQRKAFLNQLSCFSKFNYVSKIYNNVNNESNIDEWDYENTRFNKYGLSDDYELIKKIGRGKYSEVFLGIDLLKKEKVVIKVLKPVRQSKIEREIMILKRMQGVSNVIQLKEVIKERGSNTPCLVMEWIQNTSDTKTLFQQMNSEDIQYYMY
jgi:casein kinase II subunit alpha